MLDLGSLKEITILPILAAASKYVRASAICETSKTSNGLTGTSALVRIVAVLWQSSLQCERKLHFGNLVLTPARQCSACCFSSDRAPRDQTHDTPRSC